jgi:glucan endo-1,3-alpha-glucosidase
MTTAPSIATLSTSSANSQSFNVPAGLTKLSIPISAGDTMTGRIQRDGRTLVVLDPPEFKFQGSPQIYNFNAFVASAAAA